MASSDRVHVERFLRRILRMEKQIKQLQTQPQLANSSVEGSLTFYNDGDTLVINNDIYLNGSPLTAKGYYDPHVGGAAVATGPGDMTIPLTYQPIPDTTVHVRWGTLNVDVDEWRFSDDGWSVIVPDDDGVIKAGDKFRVQYLYKRDDTRPISPPIPATLTLVGSTHHSGAGTEVALPAGTEAGDLIVVAACQRNTATPIALTDPRLTVVHSDIHTGTPPTASGAVGYGAADGSGDPIAVTTLGGTGGGWVEIATFRVTGTVNDRGFTAFHTRGANPTSPAMPADDMGIVVLMGVYNIVADTFHNDTTHEWTSVSSGIDSAGSTFIAYSTTGTPPGSWPGMSSTARVASLVIGLTETPGA